MYFNRHGWSFSGDDCIQNEQNARMNTFKGNERKQQVKTKFITVVVARSEKRQIPSENVKKFVTPASRQIRITSNNSPLEYVVTENDTII